MKQRLADYVADFFVSHGVTDCFSVVGGGAMHLNDALGHKEGLKVTYNHHEQACTMAAEAYARIDNRIAAVCVTSGPGSTNAITGVLGAWLDSIPMFVVSGQMRYDTTIRYMSQFTDGLPLRCAGDQECDIVSSVSSMTKYARMIENPNQIRYVMEKAWHLATTGRPGPVWVDIPVNFQNVEIEVDALSGYDSSENDKELPPPVSDETIECICRKIKAAKRPVIYAGYGIRLSGAYAEFRRFVEKIKVPVVTYWNTIDMIETDSPYYCGRGGYKGDRPGNWAVQNADLLISIGSRLSIRQTGYGWDTWARAAEVIMIDIDRAEMKKPTIHVEFPVWADAKDFLKKMNDFCQGWEPDTAQWLHTCQEWKKNYPVVTEKHWAENGHTANVYAFIDYLSQKVMPGSMVALTAGASCEAGHQAFRIKDGTRIANNNAVASMGEGLPSAIGMAIGSNYRNTICIECDGGIMMNLQELQTIITNQLPIKVFLINNSGYQTIRITQNNFYSERSKVGIGPESRDLSFPDYKKIAEAFGYTYYCAHSNHEMRIAVDKTLECTSPVFCEIFTDTNQVWEPKSKARKLPDGSLVSPPLEDLAPFLPIEEIKAQMFIPMIGEQ